MALLDRIDALPLSRDERASLMRQAIAEQDAAPAPDAPSPTGWRRGMAKRRDDPTSTPNRLRTLLADGAWRTYSDIRKGLGMRSSNLSTALRDMMRSGEVERKEDGYWAANKPMIWYRLAQPADAPRTFADYDAETL